MSSKLKAKIMLSLLTLGTIANIVSGTFVGAMYNPNMYVSEFGEEPETDSEDEGGDVLEIVLPPDPAQFLIGENEWNLDAFGNYLYRFTNPVDRGNAFIGVLTHIFGNIGIGNSLQAISMLLRSEYLRHDIVLLHRAYDVFVRALNVRQLTPNMPVVREINNFFQTCDRN